MHHEHSPYAVAREPYKSVLPAAFMHHMMPRERGGPEVEHNLFPWNIAAHRAWHQLFEVMTVREVWQCLDEVYERLLSASGDTIVRTWCLSEYYHGKPSKKNNVLAPKKVVDLLQSWQTCFGATNLQSARSLLRYMMLFMIFGRYALPMYELPAGDVLERLVASVSDDEDRAWAFRTCFDGEPGEVELEVCDLTIRDVRRIAITIPVH